MESGNMLGLTLGIGALGTVLAYYGYNQLTDETDELEINKRENDNKEFKNKNIGTTDDLRNQQAIEKENNDNESENTNDVVSKTDNEPINDKENIEKETIKKEIKEEVQQVVRERKGTKAKESESDKPNEWSSFWKHAYEDKDETNYLDK